jgi:hypothetical protein
MGTTAQTDFAMVSRANSTKAILPRQQSESRITRALIGISELDSRIQDRIAEYGSIKHFKVMLWRQDPDASGSNWDARIYRIDGDGADDSSWWTLIPQMREGFNLI